MTKKVQYRLTPMEWTQAQQAREPFQRLFALNRKGVNFEDERRQAVYREVLRALDIEPGDEHSLEAHSQICPAARFASGFLKACPEPDGSCLLYPVSRP